MLTKNIRILNTITSDGDVSRLAVQFKLVAPMTIKLNRWNARLHCPSLFHTTAFDDPFEFIATSASLISDDEIEVETNT